jgi:hypothetical protein
LALGIIIKFHHSLAETLTKNPSCPALIREMQALVPVGQQLAAAIDIAAIAMIFHTKKKH